MPADPSVALARSGAALARRLGLAGGAAQSLRLVPRGERLLLLVQRLRLRLELLEAAATRPVVDRFLRLLRLRPDRGLPALLHLSEPAALGGTLPLGALLLLLLALRRSSTALVGRLLLRRELGVGVLRLAFGRSAQLQRTLTLVRRGSDGAGRRPAAAGR